MTVDNSYQPAVYKEAGGNKLVVKSTGEIEINGSLTIVEGATVTGLADATQLPLDATDSGQIDNLHAVATSGDYDDLSNAPALVDIATLALPSGDGNYQLTITSGVASWTEIT